MLLPRCFIKGRCEEELFVFIISYLHPLQTQIMNFVILFDISRQDNPMATRRSQLSWVSFKGRREEERVK